MKIEKHRMYKIEMYSKIYKRAVEMGFKNENKLNVVMDIESADKKFNLDLEAWLNADDFNFAHDFVGIISNIDRSEYPATNFGYFLPRFARKDDWNE